MSKYAALLIISAAVPFIVSFWGPLKFWRNLKSLVISIGLVVFIFGVWDIFAAWRKHWYFDPAGVGDISVINLPLEEVLFFVVIPFCCIFTWEAIKYISSKLK